MRAAAVMACLVIYNDELLNGTRDRAYRAPRGRARDGLAAGEKLETKPTSERSLSNMSSWVRGADREWV